VEYLTLNSKRVSGSYSRRMEIAQNHQEARNRPFPAMIQFENFQRNAPEVDEVASSGSIVLVPCSDGVN
jgi:hypothetical protein